MTHNSFVHSYVAVDDSTSQTADSVFESGGSVHNRASVRSSCSSMGSAISFESAADRGPHIRFLLGILKVSYACARYSNNDIILYIFGQ